MVVVVCDGACGDSTTLDLDSPIGLDQQLRDKAWMCAADGADLCGECSRKEIARAALLERLAQQGRPRVGGRRLMAVNNP